jgi:preprotein translocase subunit SecE
VLIKFESLTKAKPINQHTMNKVSAYFRDSYHELVEKVTWPTWLQLQQSTLIVLVGTAIITIMVLAMDFSSNQLLTLIYSLFKK